ncbi:uncharacterized protein LOC104908080 isoform X2 [Beta vulgaris subsp. vulgaris]|uniref:uncharacterized protein LOC104908080 isoform X2 n=2 Tax=Beta vulgaris subsp. vulgaris TaxID=3555 RepID=UPI002546DBBC|nr:uncharacterized protein LOC104908080 isoform X2 [Beta vulgaris subsp. vulgaris]
MGKSLPSTAGLKNFARIITSEKIFPPKQVKPTSNNKVSTSIPKSATEPTKMSRVDSAQLSLKMENSSVSRTRVPLAEVVSDCARRWFQDTLKEARDGDTAMQVLVGQMYNSGYGVPKNTEKDIMQVTQSHRISKMPAKGIYLAGRMSITSYISSN